MPVQQEFEDESRRDDGDDTALSPSEPSVTSCDDEEIIQVDGNIERLEEGAVVDENDSTEGPTLKSARKPNSALFSNVSNCQAFIAMLTLVISAHIGYNISSYIVMLQELTLFHYYLSYGWSMVPAIHSHESFSGYLCIFGVVFVTHFDLTVIYGYIQSLRNNNQGRIDYHVRSNEATGTTLYIDATSPSPVESATRLTTKCHQIMSMRYPQEMESCGELLSRLGAMIQGPSCIEQQLERLNNWLSNNTRYLSADNVTYIRNFIGFLQNDTINYIDGSVGSIVDQVLHSFFRMEIQPLPLRSKNCNFNALESFLLLRYFICEEVLKICYVEPLEMQTQECFERNVRLNLDRLVPLMTEFGPLIT